MTDKKPKYQMRYALGGGFGGCDHAEWEDCESKTEREAMDEAWIHACEEYDSYGGMHGLTSVEGLMEEEDLEEDDAIAAYEEERESWLDYEVREYQEEEE
jgi:hypothetical protein